MPDHPATSAFRPCFVIPVFNHGDAITGVVDRLRRHGLVCWLVDDGSDRRCADVLDALHHTDPESIRLQRLQRNSGKGAAFRQGLLCAEQAGFTHVIQIDADGQHDPEDVPRLLDEARAHPDAVITGVPIYDESVPRVRLYGRYLTHVWVWINTMSMQIRDSMCGFRIYPVASTSRLMREARIGNRMEFDTDILVHAYWDGVRVINVPTRVRYPDDGVSHFRMLRDNARISLMHARLFLVMLWRRCGFGPPIRPWSSNRKN
ncbi:glycosyltransferase family 2 protein [uncultured Abyssibacter sp.]|uniref:glycosyltransferase family 2 protein n=1 Tax=uncultured Abyssibacter sp. TaxID=2320202 RepID=UPI0032B1895D